MIHEHPLSGSFEVDWRGHVPQSSLDGSTRMLQCVLSVVCGVGLVLRDLRALTFQLTQPGDIIGSLPFTFYADSD